MLLLAALWLGVGAADLVRWSPESATPARRAASLAAALAGGLGLALLVGGPAGGTGAAGWGRWATGAAIAGTSALGALVWVATTSRAERGARPAGRAGRTGGLTGAGTGWALLPLAALAALVVTAVAAGPLAGGLPADAPLARWWGALAGAGLAGLAATSPAQGLLAATGALVLLGTGNRVVRLVLTASGTPPERGEASLRGGRLLGPLERVFLLALALSGDLTAAAAVIAAKGLLRLPEVRTASRLALAGPAAPPATGPASAAPPGLVTPAVPAVDPGPRPLRGPDVVTEYFLAGTFTSWLLALGVAGAVALAAP